MLCVLTRDLVKIRIIKCLMHKTIDGFDLVCEKWKAYIQESLMFFSVGIQKKCCSDFSVLHVLI